MTDDLQHALNTLGYEGHESLDAISAALDTKDARITELEAALKPFADEADNWDDEMDPDDRKVDDLGVSDITYGHCRTARAVLKGSTDD